MTHPRGDVCLRINGEERLLRLTLGALAEIEEALGGGDIKALAARLKTPRASDIILILNALLAGGGARLGLEALKASDIDLGAAARAIAQAFAALGEEEADVNKAGDNDAPGKSASGEG